MKPKKDWVGTGESIFKMIGASNHTEAERQAEDFYASPPIAAELLLGVESFSHRIWEPACGLKHLSKVFEKHGFDVRSSDIIDRCGNEVYDFLDIANTDWDGDIITNPPYRHSIEFIEKALQIIPAGRKVAMFLKLQFLEGKARRALYDSAPPHVVYVCSSRITCAMNGEFDKYQGSAVCYAWFVWEKGYKGDTIIKWIN